MSSVYSSAGFAARRRAPQRQQQPERFALNLQQQQQGSSEYQQGQGLRADLVEAGIQGPREARCYIREASANIDA